MCYPHTKPYAHPQTSTQRSYLTRARTRTHAPAQANAKEEAKAGKTGKRGGGTKRVLGGGEWGEDRPDSAKPKKKKKKKKGETKYKNLG